VSMDESTGQPIELGETVELTSSTSDVKPPKESADRCERTFITFSDDRTFNRAFRFCRPRPAPRNYCILTRYASLQHWSLKVFKVHGMLTEIFFHVLKCIILRDNTLNSRGKI